MYRFLFAFPLLALSAAAAHAEPLSFEDALARAQGQAPSIRARLLEAEARRSAATAAGQLPDPKLGVGLDNFPVSGPPAGTFAGDSMTMGRVGISQDVPNLAKRHARTGRAEADVAAAQASNLSEARRVRVATALAWISLAYAERRLAAVDGVKADLQPMVGATRSGVASGTVRLAQALDIQQALAALEDKRSEVAADLGRARATLTRWTGDSSVELAGDIPQFTVDPAALRAAIDRHPDLAVSITRTRQAEADITVARAEKRPDWGFDVAYQRRADRYGDMVSAGVSVSLPLFARKRQDPMIAASVATAGAAMAEQEDMRRSLTADLESGLADHVMHHEQWMRARDTLLPLAQRKTDLETASYGAGRAGLVDVIQSRSMLADTKLQTLDREAEVARDAARLVLTYGDDDK
ncbi:transporter [Sphingobium sp. 22B]|uniref:TolC family protein n=1 Tax=unclassified Sphingobium TaxID=2611147 RepID=UPI0005CC0EB2|nr:MULTISPECIES: TolC family protein [unclassified Sphingobium]OAP32292.1 transporter [Sphingobium sp. 20006FA]AJR25300.1 transporter [Sphingobium sp. YBL2]KXU33083.1 transporter [Sphingobium sp. AM]KYC33917.1 transporter [Sphingobium sp. 22B]UXC91796.1 TolC family protein [Sphingobium sp. RSMS]